MKAILVDDEPKSREVLRTLLERYCPQVVVVGEAGSSKEAKLLALHTRPDVIFLDVEMPGGNGFRLLDELNDKSIGIIFVTSYGHYAIPALRYSAIDYLLKPVEVEELKQAIERLSRWLQSGERLEARYETLKNNLEQPPQLQRLAIAEAEGARRGRLAPVHGVQAGAEHLGDVGAIIEGQRQAGGIEVGKLGEDRQSGPLQAEPDDEQDEKRGDAAEDVGIGGGKPAGRRPGAAGAP